MLQGFWASGEVQVCSRPVWGVWSTGSAEGVPPTRKKGNLAGARRPVREGGGLEGPCSWGRRLEGSGCHREHPRLALPRFPAEPDRDQGPEAEWVEWG